MDIACIEDVETVAHNVGLPVGSRIGRSQEKKEWFVLLGFLRPAIAAGLIELPVSIQLGTPPNEPDFVVKRAGPVIGYFEITEASDEADQKEMTALERSGGGPMLLGEFGGRFADGASQPGIAWAADILDAIRRKRGKAIFQPTTIARHLLIYPNSNASFLLFDADDERVAADYLELYVTKESENLSQSANDCFIHVLCKHFLIFDVLGGQRLIPLS